MRTTASCCCSPCCKLPAAKRQIQKTTAMQWALVGQPFQNSNGRKLHMRLHLICFHSLYQNLLFWVTGIKISCFGSQVSTFLVLGHTQLICNWLQCTASWKDWCHSQVSTAGALARDKLQQRVGKTCRQTQKQGQGQTKRMHIWICWGFES